MRSGMAWIYQETENEEFQYQINFKSKPTTNLTTVEGNIAVYLSNEFDYLNDGDIVKLDFKNKRINTLFRVNSEHNTLLLTERCNHFCLMCSQPPKNTDDSWLLKDAFDLISLIPESAVPASWMDESQLLMALKFPDKSNEPFCATMVVVEP